MIKRQLGLTDIRQRKRRILPAGDGQVLIAFRPVVVTDCEIMSPKVFPTKAAFVIANPKSKLLDQLREVMRVKHYSLRTEEAYGQWVRRYLKFHRTAAGAWRHPRDLGAAEVVAFLNHLAKVENVAAVTQNQALNVSGRGGSLLPSALPGGRAGEDGGGLVFSWEVRIGRAAPHPVSGLAMPQSARCAGKVRRSATDSTMVWAEEHFRPTV